MTGDDVTTFQTNRWIGDASNDEFRDLVRRQLELLGEDPTAKGSRERPQRVATSLAWLTRGYEMDVQQVVERRAVRRRGRDATW